MFQRILIPVDFTEKNLQAIEAALKIASIDKGELTLLHVIQTLEFEDETIAAYYETLEERAWERMRALAERFQQSTAPIQQRVVFGNRAISVLHYVVENGIDLVVLSSHRLDLEGEPKNWATLSYQVSMLCPCPAMLVK